MRDANCKGCNKPIKWGQDATGKWIPLDNTVPIYRRQTILGVERVVRDEDAYVSHFITCPKANDFSGSRPKPLPTSGAGR